MKTLVYRSFSEQCRVHVENRFAQKVNAIFRRNDKVVQENGFLQRHRGRRGHSSFRVDFIMHEFGAPRLDDTAEHE